MIRTDIKIRALKMSTCSGSEVESSEVVGNLKSMFRVSVCLQHYFKDGRQRSYILVSRKRRVRWLEQRLKKLFQLQDFYLCTNGHYLPSSELLALLSPEDRIEVVPYSRRNGNHGAVPSAAVTFTNTIELLNRRQLISPIIDNSNDERHNGDIDKYKTSVNPYEYSANNERNSEKDQYRFPILPSDSVNSLQDNAAKENELQAAKRRALSALDELGSGPPPPRRRRRVRRRRAHVTSPGTPPASASPATASPASPASPASAQTVERNKVVGSHKSRLIQYDLVQCNP